jgi:hypothetical protein
VVTVAQNHRAEQTNLRSGLSKSGNGQEKTRPVPEVLACTYQNVLVSSSSQPERVEINCVPPQPLSAPLLIPGDSSRVTDSTSAKSVAMFDEDDITICALCGKRLCDCRETSNG